MIQFFQGYFGANNYKSNDLNSNDTNHNDSNPANDISDVANNVFSASKEPGSLFDRVIPEASAPAKLNLFQPDSILALFDRVIPEASAPYEPNLFQFVLEPDHFQKQFVEASAPDFNLIKFDQPKEEADGPDVSDIEEEAEGPSSQIPDHLKEFEEVNGSDVPGIEDLANTDDFEDQMAIGPEEVEGSKEEVSEVEGSEEEIEGPFGDDEVQNSYHSTAYKLAKIYIRSADIGMKAARKTGCGIARFTSAFSRTTVRAWNLGARQCVKNIAKESMGSKQYTNALNTLKSSWSGQSPSRRNLGERMGLAETLGEATAHVCKGLGIATFTGMYAFGTVSYLLGYDPANNLSLHMAANYLASGVNNASGIVLSLGSQVVFPLIENTVTDPVATVNNAWTIGCLGVTAAVMGTSLYYASSSFIKAADSQSYFSKVKHNAIVVASLAATVAIPCLMCTSSL